MQFQYLKELSYRKTETLEQNKEARFQYLKELSYRKTKNNRSYGDLIILVPERIKLS